MSDKENAVTCGFVVIYDDLAFHFCGYNQKPSIGISEAVKILYNEILHDKEFGIPKQHLDKCTFDFITFQEPLYYTDENDVEGMNNIHDHAFKNYKAPEVTETKENFIFRIINKWKDR
jgi:hypothetical protein